MQVFIFACTDAFRAALGLEIFYFLFRTTFLPFISIKYFNYWLFGPITFLLFLHSFLYLFLQETIFKKVHRILTLFAHF